MRVSLPFVSTSFVKDLWYYALLWPLWWALGIEQILLPFFVIYELLRFLIRSDWRVRINTTGFIALALAIWWIVPVIWVEREFLDIFLKDTATIWSQAIILILIFNCVRTRQDWWILVKALTIIAVYMALAGVIYLSGIWRGTLTSVLSMGLPSSLVENSVFFSSIAFRDFGQPIKSTQVVLLPFRLSGFSLTYSSLSMICLILIPFTYWRMKVSKSTYRILFAIVTIGLLISLIFTESRVAYLALAAAIPLYWIISKGLLRGHNLPFSIALTMAAVGGGILLGYIAQGFIFDTLQSAFIDLRPGSWMVRLKIYEETLRLLPEHLIAGWGVSVRIPGVGNEYAAGTHSSVLGMLFQHGIVGLALYLALWISLWKQVIQGVRDGHGNRKLILFWATAAAAFLAFNIRELFGTWWWDQLLMFVVWGYWGAVITAARCLGGDDMEEREVYRDLAN